MTLGRLGRTLGRLSRTLGHLGRTLGHLSRTLGPWGTDWKGNKSFFKNFLYLWRQFFLLQLVLKLVTLGHLGRTLGQIPDSILLPDNVRVFLDHYFDRIRKDQTPTWDKDGFMKDIRSYMSHHLQCQQPGSYQKTKSK